MNEEIVMWYGEEISGQEANKLATKQYRTQND